MYEVELMRLGECSGEGISGAPFAWKNIGADRSSPMVDPTAELLDLIAGGIESPLA